MAPLPQSAPSTKYQPPTTLRPKFFICKSQKCLFFEVATPNNDHVRNHQSETQQRLNLLCEENKTRREATEASISTHRPLQRLLLAAVYRALSLSQDLMLIVSNHLSESTRCPFTSAGEVHVLASHSEVFAWHAMAGAAAGGETAAGGGEKASKRPRRD